MPFQAEDIPSLLAEFQLFDVKRHDFIQNAIDLLTSLTMERDQALQQLQRERNARKLVEWQMVASSSDEERPHSATQQDPGSSPEPRLYSDMLRLHLGDSGKGENASLQLVGDDDNGEHKGPGVPGRPYAILLLDVSPDAFVFEDLLLPRSGKHGATAAEKLHDEIRAYLKRQVPGGDDLEIAVKAFANVECLSQGLMKVGASPGTISELRPFFSEFSGRYPLMEFSDVGPGKVRALDKVHGAFDFHFASPACKHLILGCSLESESFNLDNPGFSDPNVYNRLTVLEKTPTIRTEKPPRSDSFRTACFRAIFSPDLATSIPKREVTANGLSSPIAPIGPASSRANNGGGANHAIGVTYKNSQAKPERLGPALYNKRGQRVDRPLHPSSESITWVKKGNICPHLFLRGECKEVATGKCRKQHSCRPLDAAEWEALWFVTRKNPCRTFEEGKDCRNPTCVYGHGVN